MTDPSMDDETAMARRRRIERRTKNRNDGDSVSGKRYRDDDSEFEDDEYDDEEEHESKRLKPSIRGIKKQARYEPGVPMTKEQLAVWRKEARRVRNRESAAASRRKTKERIDELEIEVDELRAKYEAALQRIKELEAMKQPQDFFATDLHMAEPVTISPASSVVAPSPDISSSASPPLSPREVMSLPTAADEKFQHIMNMISRPTAA